MLPVKRFRWDSAEYAEAFATLMRCAGERVYERQILRELFSAYPAESHAVDWGAGSGDLTSLMLEHFHQVYAVELHPGMCAVLATRCPRAQEVCAEEEPKLRELEPNQFVACHFPNF